MSTKDTNIAKILGEGAVKCLTTLLSSESPLWGLVDPVIDTVKELRDFGACSNRISFSDIENICKTIVPDHIAQYRGIVSVATDICLKETDFLTNPYEPKDYSQRLTNHYIKDYSNHYGAAELERIKKFLPQILEVAIPKMERHLENDYDFRIKWRTVANSRFARIEERQDAQEAQLASHEQRIRRQEEICRRTTPKISELSDTYRSRWNSSLFLDKSRLLSQVYLLPNYQILDYWNDEEDDYENVDQYADLNVQLQDTLSSCNNLDTRMLVVLGHPGGGKSTLITYLLNNLPLNTERIIRVFRFSGFESINWNNDPENIPQHMLNDMGLIKSELSNSVLILDGLDEIQMHNDHEEFLNYLYQQWARSREIKRFSLIITCRRNRIQYLDDLQMRHILLCPFNEKQIEQFASAYWGKEISVFDPKQADLVTGINNSSIHLRDVLGIPLVLYMALALEIDLSDGTGLCDIYEHIFSVKNEKNSIYYRRYDKVHPITCVEAEKIQEFSKEVAKQIWEFKPSEGTVDKEKYEPIARRIASDNVDGLRELLVGQYFMEGKEGCQLLFVHRSMYEYFVALSICDSIEEMIASNLDPAVLYGNVPFAGGSCELSAFSNTFGLQSLIDYPEIQDFLLRMLQKRRLGNPTWWKTFFSEFLNKGLSNAANNRPKGGLTGLNEELNRFYNLIWLTRELLESYGETAPHLLNNSLRESIYLRIPYNGKKDLQRVSLEGIELMGHDFVEAHLEKANLSKAVLNRANFSDANLEEANLHSAEIEQASFSFASLRGVNFRYARLKDAQFDNANLKCADFSDADLSGADFSHAVLSGAVFTGAALFKANFSDAVIENCIFDKADMAGAILTGLHLKHSSFVNTNFEGASLDNIKVSPGTSMKNTIFNNCNLSYADFQHVDLSFAQLENAIMYEIYLCDSNLNGANLRDAELSGSNLEKASLAGAQLRNAIFDNSNMKFANLENADLRGASLMYTDLTNVRIIKTKVQSDTLDTIICDLQDRSGWIIDDSFGFDQDKYDSLRTTDFNKSEFIEVDNNMFVNKYELGAYERQCYEDNELYFDSDIF